MMTTPRKPIQSASGYDNDSALEKQLLLKQGHHLDEAMRIARELEKLRCKRAEGGMHQQPPLGYGAMHN